MSEAKRTMYQDKPLLMLQDKKYILTFGNSKAKLILEHIEDIKLFVESNTKTEVK